jgi:DNA-binding IscR family transcriptional regulator
VLRHGQAVGAQQGYNGGWKLKSMQQTVDTVQRCIDGTVQPAACAV